MSLARGPHTLTHDPSVREDAATSPCKQGEVARHTGRRGHESRPWPPHFDP